jgi:hypothetical protein
MENTGPIIKEFQLGNISIKDKSDPAYGLKIAMYIDSTIGGGISSYYWARNNRFKLNRNAANGKINMAKFQDMLDFNGKINYANINWQSIKIVNRIISGLVGRWMERNEKIQIQAIDNLSTKEKIEEYKELDFLISNREYLEKLEQESGMRLVPDKDIPETKDELNLWATQFQKLPEEIIYELACNDILRANGWFDTLKAKMLHDSAEVGLVGTYTWMDEEGVIHVDYVKPENMIYSYSDYNDLRDTAWRGQVKSLKISEIRRRYGKEFGGSLTEEQIWEIAATSKDFQYNDKLRWDVNWNVTFFRPYDEFNVDVLDFEIKTIDTDKYTVVTTKKNKSTLLKKSREEKLADNEEQIDDTKWNIYRGVMVRVRNVMLEWGLKRNMIRPQDPKEAGNAEFSYSLYMYQNYSLTNMAVPEKIEEPSDQMILARLKIQQLVAKMRPTGALINWDALQSIDYGLGDANKTIDVMKLYDQTGTLYYRGRDDEGNPVPVPITELSNSGFLPQMQGLIQLYNFHYSVLKDELGEDPNLAASALQPRVTSGNIDTAQQVAANATDYMYDAYVECMKQTARKISCLLSKSVQYGAKAYRHLLGERDVDSRVFNSDIRLLPTGQEIMMLDAKMNQAIAANPQFAMYIDTFKIIRIAKEDVKLAEEYYRISMKKMLESQQQQAMQNQQMTIQGQMQSAQVAEQEKRKSLEMELEMKKMISDMETTNDIKKSMVAGLFGLYQKGVPVPQELKALESEIIQNIALPLFAENVHSEEAITQGQQAAAEQQQMQAEQGPAEEAQEAPEEQTQQEEEQEVSEQEMA